MAGEVSFQITEDDYVAANRDWAFRKWRRIDTSKHDYLFWLIAVFVPLLILVPLLAAAAREPDGVLASSDGLVALAVGMFVIWQLLIVILLPYRARRLFRQHKMLHCPVIYRWSAEGLAFETEHATGLARWTDLHGWRDGKDALLVYLNERMFYVFPRRVLSADQLKDLQETATLGGAPSL